MKASLPAWLRTGLYQLGGLIRNLLLVPPVLLIYLIWVIAHAVSPKQIKRTYIRYKDHKGKFTWEMITIVLDRYIKTENIIRMLTFECIEATHRSYDYTDQTKQPDVKFLERIHNYYDEQTKSKEQ